MIVLGYGVTGLHWGGPISTRLNTYNGLGWTPKPTAGISQASLGIIKLLRRQETRVNVCGYIDGDLGTVNALKTIRGMGLLTRMQKQQTLLPALQVPKPAFLPIMVALAAAMWKPIPRAALHIPRVDSTRPA